MKYLMTSPQERLVKATRTEKVMAIQNMNDQIIASELMAWMTQFMLVQLPSGLLQGQRDCLRVLSRD